MQEKAGGVRTGEGVSRFPEAMAEYTSPVSYFTYIVSRETWIRNRQKDQLDPGNR